MTENSESYKKYKMMKVLKNESFSDQVVDVVPGNVQTLVLFQEKESHRNMVIQAGITTVAVDENNPKTSFTSNEISIEKPPVQDIPSLPFEISIDIPVSKVACGDLFAAALTV